MRRPVATSTSPQEPQAVRDLRRILELVDATPCSAEVKESRRRVFIRFLKDHQIKVKGGMAIDDSGDTPQLVPLALKVRRIVEKTLRLLMQPH